MISFEAIIMKKHLSFIKFSRIIFAMPFALIGFFLVVKSVGFEWNTLMLVGLFMIFARSAAMGFNRYIDRNIDKANDWSSLIREIPNGSISVRSALIFVIINSLLFVATTYHKIIKDCYNLCYDEKIFPGFKIILGSKSFFRFFCRSKFLLESTISI